MYLWIFYFSCFSIELSDFTYYNKMYIYSFIYDLIYL